MPNRRFHKYTGAGVGAVYSGYRARTQRPTDWLVEVAGGTVGGLLGGVLPDVLEPATSSWHRGAGHSWTAGTAVFSMAEAINASAEACRGKALEYRYASELTIPHYAHLGPKALEPHLVSNLAELFWRFLSGFLNGLAAGYLSHLALDAMSPRSIPLLARNSRARSAGS